MSEVALNELQPLFRRIFKDFDPFTGGSPTDEFELTFICPMCGPPSSISIRIGPQMRDAPLRCWQARPVEPPNDGTWLSCLSITPSIDNTQCGHGPRKPMCSFHGSIVSGRVVFP